MIVHFSLNEIWKIIIEAHRHGVTSICRLEICGKFICKPRKSNLQISPGSKDFLIRIDKGNISYRYKENRPSETVGLSYFSWYVVKFEYLIYDMFLYVAEMLLDKNFVYENPSGFNPGNSQSNQHIKHVLALSIIMDLEKSPSIYQTFLLNYNIKELFTNYSKIGSKKAS